MSSGVRWQWLWGLMIVLTGMELAGAAEARQADTRPTQSLRYLSMPDGDPRDVYNLTLLRAVLEVTESDFGPWRLDNIAISTLQQRAFHLLQEGAIDIYWGMTSRQREQTALPVRFPLMAGLLGYRVLLIRKSDEPRFARIQSLGELRSLSAIQGHDWPDTDILRFNGLPVATDADYYVLFHSLADRLVDYFPRGVLEAYAEQELIADPTLMVEPRLLLTYPTASYFFVAKDNRALAERLATGLERLLASGRFDDILFGLPMCRDALRRANLGTRLRIELENPHMSALPLERPELWYSRERYERWLERQEQSGQR